MSANKNMLNSLVSFNQIQIQIVEDFKNIFEKYRNSFWRSKAVLKFDYLKYAGIIKNNDIIFNNENIILFNFLELKLTYNNENDASILINFLHPADKEFFEIINIVNQHWNDILRILINWDKNFKLFGQPINNFLDTKYLNVIIDSLKIQNKFDLIIPIKDLIYENYSQLFNDLNINKNFELILSMNIDKTNTLLFNYEILLFETTNIDVTKATPYLLNDMPQKLILEGKKPILELSHFLQNLYTYGRI